jgi:hypothetical protein
MAVCIKKNTEPPYHTAAGAPTGAGFFLARRRVSRPYIKKSKELVYNRSSGREQCTEVVINQHDRLEAG